MSLTRSNDPMGYSFELREVEVDMPMLDLASVSQDGTRVITLSAFGIVGLFLPTLLRHLKAIESVEPRQSDLPESAAMDFSPGLMKVVFKDIESKLGGYIICNQLIMMSHDWKHERVAFNHPEVRSDPASRVEFSWSETIGKRFILPGDNSLYDTPLSIGAP